MRLPVLQHLQTQLQLQNPLLFKVRLQLAGVNANLFLALLFELPSESVHLSLELFFRSYLSNFFFTFFV